MLIIGKFRYLKVNIYSLHTGIVSNEGQYPSAHNEEQNLLLGIGPMCRYAQDMSPILEVIAEGNAEKLNLHSKVDISSLKVSFSVYKTKLSAFI